MVTFPVKSHTPLPDLPVLISYPAEHRKLSWLGRLDAYYYGTTAERHLSDAD